MHYSPFVSELEPKTEIEGAFLVKFLALQSDKRGKPYLNIILMDRSGEVEARLWDNAAEVSEKVQAQDIVRVAGKVNLFQGKKQLVITAVERAQADTYPRDRFLPTSHYNLEQMYNDLVAIFESLEQQPLRDLALQVIKDETNKQKLLEAPAAKSWHHAYIGGLLEHVLSISRILDFLGTHYENYYGKAINKDLIMVGGLFHDIGKLEELQWERGTEYTDAGKYIGHLVLGCELVDRYISKIENFSEELRLHVKHIILAHHGKLEYGSPKEPVSVEALIVHYIDDLDSKVNSIFGLIGKDENKGKWTNYQKQYDRIFAKPTDAPSFQGSSPGK